MEAAPGEGRVSGLPLPPDLNEQQQKTPSDTPPKRGVLAQRIIDNTISELTRYGRALREQDLISLDAIAGTVEAMAFGTAEPKLYLSTQPTGWGKTAVLVASVQALLGDPALAHVGTVIMVNTLDQIPSPIERMKLRECDYAVRVGDDKPDMNDRGLAGLCRTKGAKKVAHKYAPVLFTTQQKISNGLMLHQRDFQLMSFFDYCGPASPEKIEKLKNDKSCGRKRQVRLWDEAYLPIDPITIGSDQIAAFANRLAFSGQAEAAGVITAWLAHVETTQATFDKLPSWFLQIRWPKTDLENFLTTLAEGPKEWRTLYDAMFQLQGSTVKLHRQDYNKTNLAISYRLSIPYNIEPLLIFDASGNTAMEYTFLAKNQGNVERLPSAPKTYRNLTVGHFDQRAGQAAYRGKADVDTLAAAATEAVMDKPADEDVLIIHRKGDKAPASTLPTLIRAKVREMGATLTGFSSFPGDATGQQTNIRTSSI
jgi:hypothetical protein